MATTSQGFGSATSVSTVQPHLPTDGSTSASAGASGNINQLQTQVDQVVDIMRVNVNKVLERDQKLTDLEGRAESLEGGARQFSATSARVKRKYWWKNCKMWLILIAVIVVIIIIIVVWVVVEYKKRNNSAAPTSAPATTKGSGG